MLCSRINNGKAPKDVSAALSDLKDLMAFHQNVSVAMGTALQHLADSIFVNMANLTLLHRDSYLEHVKQGIKPDTLNQLRTAPLFTYGLFPDAVIRTAEQDIAHFETTGHALRPGPGASQQSGWRSSHRYRLMKRENTDQPVQEIKNNRHGGSLVAPEEGAVVEVIAQTLVFLGHMVTSNLNDKYRVCPTSVQLVNHRLDKNAYLNPIQTVNSSLLDSLIVPKDSKFIGMYPILLQIMYILSNVSGTNKRKG